MSTRKSFLPANAKGTLALVVVGSMIANGLLRLQMKATAKVKDAAASATGKAAA